MIAAFELAQAAPVSVEVSPALGGILILAIVALAGAIGYGVRWLMRQFEDQSAAFIVALAANQTACKDELGAITAAFEKRGNEDREERLKDREARHAIAERVAAGLSSVQAELLRVARLESRGPSSSGPHRAVADGG